VASRASGDYAEFGMLSKENVKALVIGAELVVQQPLTS